MHGATDTPEDHAAAPQAWAGIDISKDMQDVCLLRPEGKPLSSKPVPNKPLSKQFENRHSGFVALLRRVRGHVPDGTVHFCLEATGTYGQALAFFLAEGGHQVSIVNPFRIRHAALSRGVGNKTDPSDARVLADYCRKERPPLWRAAAPEVRLLTALLRRLQSLKDHLLQENNRLGDPGVPKPMQHSLGKSIRFLKREIETVEKSISAHVQAHPRLKEDRELLTSIPGISDTTAHWILAELPDVAQLASAQSAAAFAGLAPQEHRSGTSVHKATRLSKRGNQHLRRALYMPAVAAMRFNPSVRSLYDRLVAKGRPR